MVTSATNYVKVVEVRPHYLRKNVPPPRNLFLSQYMIHDRWTHASSQHLLGCAVQLSVVTFFLSIRQVESLITLRTEPYLSTQTGYTCLSGHLSASWAFTLSFRTSHHRHHGISSAPITLRTQMHYSVIEVCGLNMQVEDADLGISGHFSPTPPPLLEHFLMATTT